MNKTTLYIVDDHQIVIEGLTSFLIGNDEYSLIGSANSSNDLFSFLKHQQPDILILDIKLNGLQGNHIAKILTKEYPAIKIIFFSSNTDKNTIDDAMSSGGQGFLSKDVGEEEFFIALKNVRENGTYFNQKIQQVIYDNYKHAIQNSNESDIPLSKREIEVIKLFVDGHSYKKIAKTLFISARTVESHKKHILEKLELKTTVDLVKFAIKNGIISI